MTTQKYKDTLIKNLIIIYRLDSKEAEDAVENSTVAHMLNRSEGVCESFSVNKIS